MNEKDEIIHNLKKALEIAKKKGNALFIENIVRDIKALEAGEESPIIKEYLTSDERISSDSKV